MAEPFDTLAAQLTDVIERLAAGSVGSFDASAEIAAIMSELAPDQWAQLTQVIEVMGRVDGMLFVTGTPAPSLGVVGATAVDLVNGKFWPPKTELGWTTAAIDFVGATGPAGTITSVSAEGIAPGASPEAVAGGTPSARTIHFKIPKGDTGDGGDITDVTAETLPAGASATVTRGGTAGARTLHLGIPRGDTGTDTADVALAIMERADLYMPMTISQAAAFARRGVEFDFVNGYFRNGTEVVDDFTDLTGMTFARASTGLARNAAGVFSSFASGVPRVTDLGLLTEPLATQLLTRAAPTVAQLSLAQNCADVAAPASPPITGLAWLTMDNTAGKTAIAYQSVSHVPSTEHTESVIVHAPDGIAPVPSTSSTSGDFSFVIAGSLAVTDIVVDRLGSSNYWRCQASTTVNAAPSGSSGIIRYSGQNTRTLHFGPRQMETGPIATSPIISTGATATRQADLAWLDGLSIAGPCILLADFRFAGGTSARNVGARIALEVDAGNANDRAHILNASGAVGGQVLVGGSPTAAPVVAGTVPVGQLVQTALRVATNSVRFAKDGVLSTLDADAAVPSPFTRLGLGGRVNSANNTLRGYLARAAVLPFGGIDADLSLLS